MGNKLGMKRRVVDNKYTKPQGMYQLKDVDKKKLKKLILDSKLAPCYPGDDECGGDLDECPICFLYYPSLNRSRCCRKGICTECFLGMGTPNSTRPTQCPFCKTLNYAVEYQGVRTKEEKSLEQIEEQRVIEAKIRIRKQELQNEEERMLKRREIGSSSSRRRPSKVDSCSTAEPSIASAVHTEEVVTCEESHVTLAVTQPSCPRQNRRAESPSIIMERTRLCITFQTVAKFSIVMKQESDRYFPVESANVASPNNQLASYADCDEFDNNVRPAVRRELNESECSFQPIVGTIVPESFEEQMVLAMAVSVFDV